MKNPTPPTHLLFFEPFFFPQTSLKALLLLIMNIVFRCMFALVASAKFVPQKHLTFLFWLTGMDRESVESLLLLLSRHRPLTTHHERLSSNVKEMLSDLCRFLLSLCTSSKEFSSGHSQEFFYYSKVSMQCAVLNILNRSLKYNLLSRNLTK